MREEYLARPAPAETAAGWPNVLRSACATLHAMPSEVMPAVSVTILLDGTPGGARTIALASQRLAREYGCQETIALDNSTLTVRFSHLAAVREATETESIGN